MSMWFRLAVRELINHRGFSLFFLANLTIGLVGFIALDSFKLSLHDHIQSKSKSILAADLTVRSARPFTDKEKKVLETNLPEGTTSTAQMNFMTMVRAGESSRLIELVAISPGYPLYGEMVLSEGRLAGAADVERRLIAGKTVWVQPELLQILGLKIGQLLKVGELNLRIDEQLIEAPGQNFWGAGIAYKVFMGYDQALESGLISKGSRRYYTLLFKLPEGSDAEKVAQGLEEALKKTFGPSPYLRIKTHAKANQQMSWLLNYLNDYLGLVALVALFLAGMGTSFLFRSFLKARVKELAILRALGAKPTATLWLSVMQIGLLGFVAAMLASVLAQGALPVLADMAQVFLPIGFVTKLSYQSMALALVVGIVGSVLFCLPLLLSLPKISPKVLLSEQETTGTALGLKGALVSLVYYLPLTLLYWVLAVGQSRSWVTGSAFLGALLVSTLVLALLAAGLLRITHRIEVWGPLPFRLGLRNLNRAKGATLTSFVAIGLGSLLINLIPQIHQGIATEISSPEPSKLPSFFLFDIQPEQMQPLEAFISAKGYHTTNGSAMILGRLTKVRGETVLLDVPEGTVETREEKSKKWFRRRDQNLSYRSTLYETERIAEGQWFTQAFDMDSGKLPEVSLEVRYAGQIGVGLGDTLTYDIQGVELQAQVTSLRKVKWNSFRPNFYVIVQPGVLEEAPGTWLATIDRVPEAEKVGLQNQINGQFSNVSLINVSRLIGKVLGIAGQIRWAIQVMALFVVLAGLVVLYSIARFNAQARSQEINLLKILGASFGRLRWMVALEFGVIGLLASAFGSLISLSVAWGFAQLLFERIFDPNVWLLLATVSLITLMSMFTALLGTNKALNQNPARLLQAL